MEIMEKVKIMNEMDKKDKCPFCQKEPVGHKTNKKKVSEKVTSIPKNLNCKNDTWIKNGPEEEKRTTSNLPYTMAQHHLISAIQCYSKIKRLVRMGNLVEYDINCEKNGIGLPTTHWSLKYPDTNGVKKKYGKLDDDDPKGKEKVAFALMEELGAQWHVGHHAFEPTDKDSWGENGSDEANDDDLPHETSYDKLIISELYDMVKSIQPSICEDPKRDDNFKKGMDDLSKDIENHLKEFAGSEPSKSSPYFVSQKAYDYSGAKDKLSSLDIQEVF